MQNLTRDEVVARIKAAVDKKGGAAQFAAGLNVTPDYVRHVLNGKKPGPKVCAAIGVVENDKTWRVV